MVFLVIYVIGYVLTWRKLSGYIAHDLAFEGEDPQLGDYFIGACCGAAICLLWPIVIVVWYARKWERRGTHPRVGRTLKWFFSPPK